MKRGTFGPYELLDALGRGGMGVVYRARHRDSGDLVALKTVRLLKEGQLQGIRREIDTLARLNHPGIVRIVEHGVEKGQPWYAMELLHGTSLRQLLDDELRTRSPEATELAETCPETERWWTDVLGHPDAGAQTPPPRRGPPTGIAPAVAVDAMSARLRLVQRLCQTLAFLHGEGLVHRDLKPENIIIAASDEREAASGGRTDSNGGSLSRAARGSLVAASAWPVLVDFGLVSPFRGAVSRESLEVALGAHGTAAYIAPEQARGEAVDARADLYALGCILYEMLVGRPPFVGQNRYQVLWQHWEVKPTAPSMLNGGVPPLLDELVLRLLAKEPRQRLGYASDVAAILGQIAPEASTESAVLEARPYVYRAGFHGRERQVWALEQKLEEVSGGASGGLVLLGGESGAGKTRMALELSRKAMQLGFEVLLGESRSEAGARSAESEPSAGALHLFGGPLRRIADRCREMGLEETERLLGSRGPVLALYEPSLKDLPGQERYGPPTELPADAAKARLFRCLAETLEALAVKKPLFLVLDDLQWADELSVGFLRLFHRFRPTQKMPLLLLGMLRSEERNEGLEALLAQPDLWKIELGRLDEEAVGTMVADMLALPQPPKLFARYLTRHSEGNPYFVAEYVQAAVEENLLLRDRHGHWQVDQPDERRATEAAYEALELPASLFALLGRRLEGLSEGARRLVEAAAVVGREADLALLGQMNARDAQELWAELRELERRGILLTTGGEAIAAMQPANPNANAVTFAHDKIREVTYAGIRRQRRRVLHRAVAEALESRGDGEREGQLATLGGHWEQAGQRRKARACYLIAARRAVRQHALESAQQLYAAYLRLAARWSRERVEARLELVQEVLHIRGWLREADREGQLVLAEAIDLGASDLEVRALLALGKAARETGRTVEACERYDQGLTLARRIGDQRAEGAILHELASTIRAEGRLDEARAVHEAALAIHRRVGDRRAEGIVLNSLGALIAYSGDLEPGKRILESALDIHRETRNRMGEGTALHDLATVLQDQGLLDESIRLWFQVIEIHRETGHRMNEAHALKNLGSVYHDQSRLNEARAQFEQALATQREIGHRRLEGSTLANLAHSCFEQGRIHEARAHLAQSLEILRQTGQRPFEGRALYFLAELERSEGELESASAHLAEAIEQLRGAGYRVVEAAAQSELASLQVELGAPEEAARLYEQAQALHRRVGDRQSEARTRRNMAAFTRRTGIQLASGEHDATRSYDLALEVDCPILQGLCLCELGHANLAQTVSAREQLEAAERIVAKCVLEPPAPLCKASARLERAQAAFEAGRPLFRGELLEDIPVGLQRWLTDSGHLILDQRPVSG